MDQGMVVDVFFTSFTYNYDAGRTNAFISFVSWSYYCDISGNNTNSGADSSICSKNNGRFYSFNGGWALAHSKSYVDDNDNIQLY